MKLSKQNEIEEIISEYLQGNLSLFSLLHILQEKEKYLSEEVVNYLSEKIALPASRIFGIASYYKTFRIKPPGKHTLKVCDGTSCHLKGGEKLLDRLHQEFNISEEGTSDDLQFTLEKVRCLGCCHQGPVMMIDETIYGPLTQEKALKLIKEKK